MPTSGTRDAPMRAAALMLLASALFALMSLAVKTATETLPWHEVAAARGLVAAAVIWGVARARGSSLAISDTRLQWRRTIAGTLSMCFSFYCMSRLPMGDAVTIGSIMPLILALVSARLLGERAGGTLWLAMALGLAGIAALAGAQMRVQGALLGVVSGVLSACFAAVAMIQLRKMRGTENAEAVALHFAFYAGLFTLLIGVGRHVMPSPRAWLELFFAGAAGAVAQTTMTRAYALDKAARVSAIGYSSIVMSFALEAIVWHQIPSGRRVLGAALIVASGGMLVLGAIVDQRKSTLQPSPPVSGAGREGSGRVA